MNLGKVKSFCRVFRILIGLALVAYGVYTVVNEVPNYWFFLGAIPLVAGITNFCPLCMITKKCNI